MYGHIVSLDLFGEALVVPFASTLDSLRTEMKKSTISLPNRDELVIWCQEKIDSMISERVQAIEPIKSTQQVNAAKPAVMTEAVDFEGEKVVVRLRPHLAGTLASFNDDGTRNCSDAVVVESSTTLEYGMQSIDLYMHSTDGSKGDSMSKSSSEDPPGGTVPLLKEAESISNESVASTTNATHGTSRSVHNCDEVPFIRGQPISNIIFADLRHRKGRELGQGSIISLFKNINLTNRKLAKPKDDNDSDFHSAQMTVKTTTTTKTRMSSCYHCSSSGGDLTKNSDKDMQQEDRNHPSQLSTSIRISILVILTVVSFLSIILSIHTILLGIQHATTLKDVKLTLLLTTHVIAVCGALGAVIVGRGTIEALLYFVVIVLLGNMVRREVEWFL